MTEIQQNRWDQLVRRAGNVVGGGSQVGDTLNELFPTLDVEDLRAELALLSGTRLGFGAVSLAALAANLDHTQLFNPVGSNAIITLERVEMSSPTTQLIEYVVATLPLTNSTSNQALRDTREGILQTAIGQLRDVQQAAGLPTFGIISLVANVNHSLQDKLGLFVLAPGTGVTFATTTVNTTFRCNYWWRERAAEPAELNFP